ncbi:MAG: tRNA threonylcarbamoyladenosine dehydratase [Clostridia bacterium]|nr:tRNA threonylcarbamoyladenosine dehydratase [Clostridia bacterium]
MREENIRTAMVLGEGAVSRLAGSRVAVFGIGGVGGYCAEALARAGVGELHLIDSDKVSLSNINRQIIALHSTVGRYKTEAMRERILDINPEAKVVVYNTFFDEENARIFDFSSYDYVVDAIDSLKSKVLLIKLAMAAGCEIISAMGAGNKFDPTRFEVADISKTSVCPLARAVRLALRKEGITSLKVVYSKELPTGNRADADAEKCDGKRAPGSLSFVPPVMGLIIAGEVIKDICK